MLNLPALAVCVMAFQGGGPTPCCCHKITPTYACYVPGMGADCGDYSCPHNIITSEPIRRCELVASNERGQTTCETDYSLLASLCHMELWTCAPPTGCAQTGIVHHVYYFNQKTTGPVCP